MTRRDVPEWIGKTPASAIPPRVKLRLMDTQGGKCANCARKLGVAGEPVKALVNGGEHREANLQALCAFCHRKKTADDVGEKAKVDRVRKKHLGLQKPRRKMPYRRFDGTPVWPGKD